jgi:hypothetical protein
MLDCYLELSAMDIFNVAPLTERRGKGAYGGHEWKAVSNRLFAAEGRRLGVEFFPVDDASGDLYKIADGYSPGGLTFPGKNFGGEAFQYHFCRSPIPRDARRDFEHKLARLVKLKHHPVRVVTLSTPEEPKPSDIEWIVKLRRQYAPLRIGHWGHSYFIELLSHHPNLLSHVFPEIIIADGPARDHLAMLKQNLIEPISGHCRNLIARYSAPDYVVELDTVPHFGAKARLSQAPQYSTRMVFTMHLLPHHLRSTPLYSDLENHYPGLLHNLNTAFELQTTLQDCAVSAAELVLTTLQRHLTIKAQTIADNNPPFVAYESLTKLILSWAVWPLWPNQYLRHDEGRNELITHVGGITMTKGSKEDCTTVKTVTDTIAESAPVKTAAGKLHSLMTTQSRLLTGIFNTTQEILLTQRLIGSCMYS